MADRSTNILIAGCGYVGCELARLLQANEGFAIWGLRRSVEKLPASVVHPIGEDLFNPDQLGKWPEYIDYVVYTAAASGYNEDSYHNAYVKGLTNIITRLQTDGYRPKHILFISSTDVYHQKDGESVDENSPTLPETFAGKIMLEGESILLRSPFPATCVRLGGIYGPGRLWLINQVKEGKGCPSEPVIYTNRIHRDDCAGILAHLVKKDAKQKHLGYKKSARPIRSHNGYIGDQKL